MKIKETIINKPYNLRLYVTNRIKELESIIDALRMSEQLIKPNERDGEYLLRYALKNGSVDSPDEGSIPDIYMLLDGDIERYYYPIEMKESLEVFLKFGKDFLHYVSLTLQRVKTIHKEFFDTAKLLKYAEKGFIEYGYYPGNPEHENDEEYIAAKKLLDGCKIRVLAVMKLQKIYDDLNKKVNVLHHRKDYSWRAEKYRPEHDEIELLYHATIYTKEILKNGFSAERPIERKGVGNFGLQKTISFTHNLETARTIMRSFKEVWMIVHGQLTTSQILDWCKKENVYDKVISLWKSLYGSSLPNRLSYPQDIIKLYKCWLVYSKLRTCPGMVNMDELVDAMKDRTIDDIGILECNVKLSQDDEYMFAEDEFRVSPDKVLTIKRKL